MILRPSLTNRIFLASAVLVVLAVGSTAALVSTRVSDFAEGELRRGLAESGAVVERQCQVLAQEFSLLARLTADLPKLKAAIATGDAPTVRPLADEYRQMIARAGLVVVTDQHGRILANTDPDTLDDVSIAAMPSVRAAREGRAASSYWPHGKGVLQVVSVPITIGAAPATLAGTLSLGFLLDAGRALDFKTLTGSEIAFGVDGRVRAATLGPEAWPAIEASRGAPEATPFRATGEDYVAASLALVSTPGAVAAAGAGGGGGPFVVVLRSRTQQLALLSGIKTAIAVTVAIAVLLATILSYGVARSVMRPLAAITGVMREVAVTGDLTRRIPVRAGLWDDEDARLLATTFNTLTESVARFEKEAALRERLSSLGRLSSVVAHEIRNPLMIIKTAVRTLRQPAAGADTSREALQDIDDEVARLNRIVSDVLDYAKPIAFTWQHTDVDAVCRDALRGTAQRDPRVNLALETGVGGRRIVTDPDRLRAVLVNVLDNAVHAVQAALLVEPGRAEPGRVTCRTAPVEGGGVRITVRDSGAGMDAATVAHAFEPYFTTRRGGTGLGLAIVRNVVDGLGGVIVVDSAPGRGTELSITLPGRAAGAPADGATAEGQGHG